MKTRAFLLSLIMVLLVPVATNAQIGNMIRNKASRVFNAGARTANKEVDNKIDSAAQKKAQAEIDKANQDAAQNKDQNEQASQATDNKAGSGESKGFNLGGLMGGKVTSKYSDSYTFGSRIYMVMELYDKKDKTTKMDYFLYFNESSPIAGIETKMEGTSDQGDQVSLATSMVIDGINKSFIMLNNINGMKMAIISAIPDETSAQPEDKTKAVVVIKKTGNSKVIAGYKCDEYTYSDDQTKKHGTMWATKDLKINADKRAFSKSGKPSYYDNTELQNSAVLAIEQYNDKNQLEVKSDTKEVNLKYSYSISTQGYSFRQMNFNQAGGQKK